MPTRSSKLLARLTASWPVSESATSRISCGFGRPLDLGHLGHQRLVDMGAAGGVEDDHVMAAELGRLHGAPGDLDRRLAGDDRQRRHLHLLAELAQLLLRGRPPRIERGHQHFLVLALVKPLGDLGGGRRLAGALQADHHDDDRRRRVEVDRLAFAAEHLDQLVMDDLDDHLAGLDRLQHRRADRLLADAVGEGAHHVERDVGLEQRAANLAQRRRDVGLGQRAAAGQAVQDGAKPLLQHLEHPVSFMSRIGYEPRGSASATRKNPRA